MNNIKRHFFLILILIIFGLQLYSINVVNGVNNLKFQEKTIRIGFTTDNIPNAYLDTNSGEEKGIFVDLFQTIASKNNWHIEIINDAFPNLLSKLDNNDIDIIGAIAYSTSRINQYTFSNETIFTNWGDILTKDPSIKSILDLENKKLSVIQNNVHYSGEGGIVNLLNSFHVNVTYQFVQTYDEAMESVANNSADACIVNRFSAKLYSSSYNLIDTNIVFNPIELRYAININHPENLYMLQTIDQDVKSMKEDSKSDFYRIINQYLDESQSNSIDLATYFIVFAHIMILLIPAMLFIVTIVSRIQVNKKTKELQSANQAYEQINKDLNLAKNQIEERNRSQYEFFANISHELRSPVHLISGYTSLLEETNLSDEQKTSINIISRANENLSRIISDILILSQLQKTQFSIYKENFELRELLDFILAPLEIKANNKGLKLIKEIDESLFTFYHEDQLRLGQILVNLIENAIKYTHRGTITLKMKKLRIEGNKIIIAIKVIDTGIGIERDVLDKVFEPFFKIDSNSEASTQGVGLGLTIVKHLINIFNGSISISSQVDKGTTIEIEIGLEKGTIESESQPELISQNISKKPNQKILLVDDVDDNLNLLERIILKSSSNNEILKANSGQRAIEIIKNNKDIDMVFLDLRMPELDGIETAKIIRELETTNQIRPLKIIASTAYVSEDSESRTLKFDAFLKKPFNQMQVQKVLNEFSN